MRKKQTRTCKTSVEQSRTFRAGREKRRDAVESFSGTDGMSQLTWKQRMNGMNGEKRIETTSTKSSPSEKLPPETPLILMHMLTFDNFVNVPRFRSELKIFPDGNWLSGMRITSETS